MSNSRAYKDGHPKKHVSHAEYNKLIKLFMPIIDRKYQCPKNGEACEVCVAIGSAAENLRERCDKKFHATDHNNAYAVAAYKKWRDDEHAQLVARSEAEKCPHPKRRWSRR